MLNKKIIAILKEIQYSPRPGQIELKPNYNTYKSSNNKYTKNDSRIKYNRMQNK